MEPKTLKDKVICEIVGYHEWMCSHGEHWWMIEEAFELGRKYQRGTWPKKEKKKNGNQNHTR